MTLFALLPLALAGDLKLGYTRAPGPGENPALLVTPPRDVEVMVAQCDVGGKRHSWEESGISGGQERRFEWPRDESVTHADCSVEVRYTDGMAEGFYIPIDYGYGGGLSVNLDGAAADLQARTLTVEVTAPVQRAKLTAYGAHKAVLDQREVSVSGGPGPVSIPWVGEPSEVVLLDVELHNDSGWAGFTYSPWFLEIPHEDVLFATNEAEIDAEEAHKLEHTLAQLHEVLDKYGAIVPVQLYIAGCTDTVGDAGSNQGLSHRRARAIATWLRQHGYTQPIYYYGFGESFLAVPTGDEVDEQRNRRALYLVGANPPPPSTGVPQVQWIPL
jgi:outer membrane protein OmpA-like peptidoglycan-associated protein